MKKKKIIIIYKTVKNKNNYYQVWLINWLFLEIYDLLHVHRIFSVRTIVYIQMKYCNEPYVSCVRINYTPNI